MLLGDLLVDRKVLIRDALVADGTEPLRTLLLQLQVGRGVETLDMCADNPSTWHLQPHVGEGALEGDNL